MANFNSIFNNSNYDFSYDEIMENLKNANLDDFTIIFSILNLSYVNSLDDMHIIIDYLTGHADPVREAVAFKLEEIYEDKLFDDFIKNKLLDAIVDINPNICRCICSLVASNNTIKENIEYELILKIKSKILEIQNENMQLNNKKSHAKNKKIFSLYWLLEALANCACNKYSNDLHEILNFTLSFYDYTIREKSAKILAKMQNPSKSLLQIAKSDQNFYVKNQVYDKINYED